MAFYESNFDGQYYHFSLVPNFALNEHGLQKIQSLIIEEMSDFMCMLLTGRSFSGALLPSSVNRPLQPEWLTDKQEKQLKIELQNTEKTIQYIEFLQAKLVKNKSLTPKEKEDWQRVKSAITDYERMIDFYSREIITYVDKTGIKDVKSLQIGAQLLTSINSQ